MKTKKDDENLVDFMFNKIYHQDHKDIQNNHNEKLSTLTPK